MHYENIAPILYSDFDGFPLLAFSRPAIVFRWDDAGTEIGPRLATDIIVVPNDLADHFRDLAEANGLTPQDAIDQFEAEIRRLIAR